MGAEEGRQHCISQDRLGHADVTRDPESPRPQQQRLASCSGRAAAALLRDAEGTEEGHQNSHVLNTEVHGEKVCRARLPSLKPAHGRVKPRGRGWRCVSRPSGRDGGPKDRGPTKDHTP